MKSLLSVQDYLFSTTEVGDWEGDEELVTDRINAIYHAVWEQFPDDIEENQVTCLLSQLWQELAAGAVLQEVDEEELIDWAVHYVQNQLEDGLSFDSTEEDDEEE